uniref:Uncharacterized protein n=1 Tax=Arundo donax TaxID=35708 RepID=A0A0A9MXD1_ARUDO
MKPLLLFHKEEIIQLAIHKTDFKN